MVDKTSLQSYMIDTEFTRKLSYGKYSRWAKRITSAEFITIVEAIGQLGEVIWPYRKEDEKLLNRLFDNANDISPRAVKGLDFIVQIQATGYLDWSMPSGWDKEFSGEGSAFKQVFRDELSQDVHTQWVSDLSVRLVALILWMVGEYCIRTSIALYVKDNPLKIPGQGASDMSHRITRSLLQIERIYSFG